MYKVVCDQITFSTRKKSGINEKIKCFPSEWLARCRCYDFGSVLYGDVMMVVVDAKVGNRVSWISYE